MPSFKCPQFLNVRGSSLGRWKRGQPHNKHKGALSAGENVVYRLRYNGLVVAGSHVHFLIFSSHAISFWEKTELRGFAFVWEGRLTTYFLSRQAWAPLPPPRSSPPFPLSGGATIFVWDLERWKSRHRLRCQSNVFGLSDWTASSTAICLLSSSVGAVWSDRETPLETQLLGGWMASAVSVAAQSGKGLHTVWLQSLCLCCVSINVSEHYLLLF